MATLKISVQKHQIRKDGTFPVSIRVTCNSRMAYIPTGVYVTRQQLTKNFEVKDNNVLMFVSAKIKKYREMLLNADLDGVDSKGIVKYLMAEKKEAGDIDFFEYGKTVAGRKTGGSEKNYLIMLNSVKRFTERDRLPFSHITVKFLRDYSDWLGEGRAVSLYMSMMRHVFREAIREYNSGLNTAIRYDPFAAFRVPRQNVAEKRSLTAELITCISGYQPSGGLDTLAKDVFMMSFYLLGINSADLYHAPPVKDGRLTYCRRKTAGRRADHALISVKLEPEALPLIEKYADVGNEFAFRFHAMYTNEINFNGVINKGLKIIGKALGIERLTYYAARHSWATIARNDCRIAKSDIHEALNHVDGDMRVTDTYIRRDWSAIDAANRKVIDRLSN